MMCVARTHTHTHTHKHTHTHSHTYTHTTRIAAVAADPSTALSYATPTGGSASDITYIVHREPSTAGRGRGGAHAQGVGGRQQRGGCSAAWPALSPASRRARGQLVKCSPPPTLTSHTHMCTPHRPPGAYQGALVSKLEIYRNTSSRAAIVAIKLW